MQVVMARPVKKYVQSVEIAYVHTWSAHQRSSSGISIGWMDALLSVCFRKMDGCFSTRPWQMSGCFCRSWLTRCFAMMWCGGGRGGGLGGPIGGKSGGFGHMEYGDGLGVMPRLRNAE